jgi:hypothetical protein
MTQAAKQSGSEVKGQRDSKPCVTDSGATSKTASFTPGPWRDSNPTEAFGLVWGASYPVADCCCNNAHSTEQRANARLIAAAPDYDAAAGLAITALAFAAETYQRAGDAVALAQTMQAKEALIAAQNKARGRNQTTMRNVTPRPAIAKANGDSHAS